MRKIALILLGFCTILAGCKKQPEACFSTSSQKVEKDELVTFDASCSQDAFSFAWDFGDGTVSASEVTSHSYSEEGTYIVTLTAYSKKEKKQDKKTTTITVEGPEPTAPLISVSSTSVTAYNGETVNIIVTMNSESKLTKLVIEPSLDLPQGETVTTIANMTSAVYNYSYDVGDFLVDGNKIDVTFTVSNEEGLSASTKTTINIDNSDNPDKPSIVVSPPFQNSYIGEQIVFTTNLTSPLPLSSMNISRMINGAVETNTVTSFAGLTSATYQHIDVLPENTSDGTIVQYIFTVFNNQNISATSTVQVTAVEPEAPTITVTPTSSEGWAGSSISFNVGISCVHDLTGLTVSFSPYQASEYIGFNPGTTSVNQSYEYTIPVSANIGSTHTLTFTATNEYNKTAFTTATVSIIEPQCGSINTFSSVELGSYNNPVGSFFASIDGTVYTVNTAASNQSQIDFVYGYGSTNLATIFAPDDDVSGMGGISTYGLSSWATKNSTRFYRVANSYVWSSITEDCVIVTEAANASYKYINNLAIGDIVAFVTAAGKKGFIRVSTINGASSTGSITLDIKVQQ